MIFHIPGPVMAASHGKWRFSSKDGRDQNLALTKDRHWVWVRIQHLWFQLLRSCGSLLPITWIAMWQDHCPGSSAHGFPRQEYWSGLPFPSPGDLPYTGTEPTSPVFPALAGSFFTTWEAPVLIFILAI